MYLLIELGLDWMNNGDKFVFCLFDGFIDTVLLFKVELLYLFQSDLFVWL